MIIQIDPSRTGPVLLDTENFRTLKLVVQADESDSAVVAETTRELCTWGDPFHVFIQPHVIHSLAGEHGSAPGWQHNFDGMLSYAASHGWVNGDGAIRVHVEYRK